MKRLLVAAGIFVFVAAVGFADDKKNPCITPVERKDKGAVARHQAFVDRAKKGDVDALFLGDSITQGWEGAKKTWEAKFGPMKPANFGIGGDRTEHVLWRITEGKELEGISPKVTVLMIGTNNSGSNSPEQIAEGVGAIVSTLRQKNIKVLLLGVFPRASLPKEQKDLKVAPAANLNTKIREINDIIKKMDDGKNIVYMDIGQKFLTDDGGLSKEIMPDLLHLSPKGYEIWADAITPKLEEMLK